MEAIVLQIRTTQRKYCSSEIDALHPKWWISVPEFDGAYHTAVS